MKFTLEPGTRANLIRGYSAAEIRIGEHRVQRSCIVTADRLITDWEPESFADLAPAHLEAILALTPEVVLLGTGATQRFAPPPVRAFPRSAGPAGALFCRAFLLRRLIRVTRSGDFLIFIIKMLSRIYHVNTTQDGHACLNEDAAPRSGGAPE